MGLNLSRLKTIKIEYLDCATSAVIQVIQLHQLRNEHYIHGNIIINRSHSFTNNEDFEYFSS